MKRMLLKLLLGLLLTTGMLNCSSSYLVGVPVFVYSKLPLGSLFLILETFSYITFFVFLVFWVNTFRQKYIYWLALVILFLLLNIIATRGTNFQFPNNPHWKLIPNLL